MGYEGDYFNEDVSFGRYGGTQSIGVSVDSEDAGSGWDYTNYAGSWVSISFDSRFSTSTMMRITASENTSSSTRDGIITISFNGSNVGEVFVEQDAGSGGGSNNGSTGNTGTTVVRETSVGSTSLSIGSGNGATASTSLKANYACTWDLDVPAINWIDAYISNNGTSAATLNVYTTEANPTTSSRSVTITVTDEDGEVYGILVTQAGGSATSSVSDSTIEQGYGSGTHYVSLISNFSTSWSASSNKSWCSATITKSSSSSSSDGELKIVVSANPDAEDRSATVVVSNSNRSHNITVYQDPAPQTYDISKSSASFTSNGGSTTASLISNGYAWYSDYSSPSWCNVSFPNNGGKNVTLSVSVDANTTVDDRNGYVKVTPNGGSTILSLQVSQAGIARETGISTSSVSIGSGSSKSTTVSLTANYNCKWGDPHTTVSWLSASVSNTSSYNETLIITTTSSNDDTNPRSGYVKISDDIGNEYTITVTQVAGERDSGVSPQIHYVGNSAGNYSSTLTANWNANWSVTSKPSWCSTSISNNNTYNAKLNITVSANPKASERTGTIYVGNGTHSFSVQIQQDPAAWSYSINPTYLTFDYGADSDSVTLSANGDATWKVYGTKPSWINSVSFPNNGNEDVTCTISAAANTTVYDRNSTVSVTPNNGTNVFNITVSQAGKPKDTSVSTTSVTVGSGNGATGSVSLTANYGCDWDFNETVSWLSASLSGDKTENATLNITTTQANPSATTRTGNITVSNDNNEEWTIKVTQNASSKSSSVNMSSYDLAKGGGTLTGTLTSNWVTNWSIVSNGDWATASLSNATNTQNGSISITAGKNPNASERTDRITVKNDNQSFNIDIRQNAGDWVYSVTPTSMSFTTNGGSKSSSLTANGYANWKVYNSNKPDWCTVTFSNNGSEDVTCNITADANTTVNDRNGYVKVTPDNSNIYTITVSQAGIPKETSISTTAVTVGNSNGSTGSVSLIANYNCKWSCHETVSWLSASVSDTSSYNETLTITATQANPSATTRSANITVSDDNGNEWIVKVTQSASSKSSSVSPASFDLEKNGETVTASLISNWVTNWEIVTNGEWATAKLSNNVSTQNGTLTITADKNPNASERTDRITVKNDDRSFNVDIRQDAGDWVYDVEPKSLSYGVSAGTKTVTLTANGHAYYKVYYKPEWCDISFPDNGGESVIGSITTTTNDTYEDRTDTVIFTPDDGVHKLSVTVSQGSISKETYEPVSAVTIGSASTSTVNVSLTANYNANWSFYSPNTWLDGTFVNNKSKSTTLTIKATQDNPDNAARPGKVYASDDIGNEYLINVTQVAAPKSSSISPAVIEPTYTGGTYDVTLTANYDANWNVKSNDSEDWVSTNITSNSTKKGNVRIVVSKQSMAYERQATIVLQNNHRTHNITVTQEPAPYKYNVTPDYLTFDYVEQTKSVTLTANGYANWKVYNSNKPDWCTITFPDNGGENVTCSIKAAANTTVYDRNGYVKVTPDNGTNVLSITVSQAGKPKETKVSTTAVTIGSGISQTKTVSLTANYGCDWEYHSTVSWLDLSISNDKTENATLNITTTQVNPSGVSGRTGNITVNDDNGNEWKIQVTQEKAALSSSVSPQIVYFGKEGGSDTCTLNANFNAYWYIISKPDYSTVTIPTYATTGGSVNITVGANPTVDPRDDNEIDQVVIGSKYTTSGNYINTFSIKIKQDAGDAYYNVIPTSINHDFQAFTETVSIDTNDNGIWSVKSNNDWITASVKSPNVKNTSITLNVSQNNNSDTRNGSVSVLFNNKIVETINVSQTKFVVMNLTVYMTGDNKLATRRDFNEQMKTNHFTSNLDKTLLIDEINGISWNENYFRWDIRIDNEKLYKDEDNRCVICGNIYKFGTNEDYL